ncbi:NADPH-dependent FMN reductase [Allobacillus sp. GCM10007491]|uniref:NAD(P)H-dependent oxidoreductase n=1 Tax=Allobacillus saliphilus TaxID=2912308 RepID=A0A941CVI5_9BACI|nr:NADPH-dependent FMN reductase [Allobacillus saliphilus]MBR7554762.1 NAD(P)H-dependent oxidoreductase [Allobacillus saliphilus]
MNILLINGTVTGEKPKVLLKQIEHYLNEGNYSYEVDKLSLDQLTLELADGRLKEDYNEDTQEAIAKMEAADGYIIATSIFQGSIPGSFKNLLDLISPKTMRYKPVSVIANGGTFQHHLVIENQLKPILSYFRSLITPNYIYAHSEHFSPTNELINEDVISRLKEMLRIFNLYMKMSVEAREGNNFGNEFY